MNKYEEEKTINENSGGTADVGDVNFKEEVDAENSVEKECSCDKSKCKCHDHHNSHRKLTKAFKVGRNELCPCGSGKKYKKCCLLKQWEIEQQRKIESENKKEIK